MILVTGSLAFDYIMDFPGTFGEHIMPDKIHKLNLSFLVNTLKKQNGGTAGNISYNMALLRTPVSVLATAGEDFASFGEFLKKSGVDTSLIKIIKDEFTATAFITTDLAHNQITAFYAGAMRHAQTLKLSDLKQKPELVVISPNDPQAMLNLSEECKKLKIDYLIDPGMQLPRFNNEQLERMVHGAKILIGNDYEMDLLADKIQVTTDKLLDRAETIITTLGSKGATIATRQQYLEIPVAKPMQVVDPTGSGDAFRGGFLAGYSKWLDLKTCGQMGAVAACFALEKYGTTSHSFTIDEFQSRYQQNFGSELLLPA